MIDYFASIKQVKAINVWNIKKLKIIKTTH